MEYDLRFRVPSRFILAGASQSGKTTFVTNLLKFGGLLFEDPRCLQNVVYYHKSVMRPDSSVTHWINEVPTAADIRDRTQLYANSGGSIVVIDDFAGDLGKDIVEVFSVLSHHLHFVVLLLTQNLFSPNKAFRDISLSSTYIIIFKNPRDSSQIINFARQIAPGNSNWIVKAFREATLAPYSYMLFDNHQTTPEILRKRSRVLPHEQPMLIWAKTN
jgi:hypothetical protein